MLVIGLTEIIRWFLNEFGVITWFEKEQLEFAKKKQNKIIATPQSQSHQHHHQSHQSHPYHPSQQDNQSQQHNQSNVRKNISFADVVKQPRNDDEDIEKAVELSILEQRRQEEILEQRRQEEIDAEQRRIQQNYQESQQRNTYVPPARRSDIRRAEGSTSSTSSNSSHSSQQNPAHPQQSRLGMWTNVKII